MADCVNHPGVESVRYCPRCGQPFCGDCLVELEGTAYCGPCKDARVQELQTTPASRRPTSVTVFGVLNIVFGAMGVLCSPFALLVLLAPQFIPQPSGGNSEAYLVTHSPLMRAWDIGSTVIGIVASAVLLAAGIGLLSLKPWGRRLSIGYAIYCLCIVVIGSIITFVFLIPAMMAEASRSNDPGARGGAIGGAIGGVCGYGISLVYAVLLLFFLTRPVVVQAFRQTDER